MNYPDDWKQFSEEYEDEVIWHTTYAPSSLELIGQIRTDFENMLLMGGEIAR